MSAGSSNQYLRDAVMTASPEQLQLMLYDGAIRFAAQGREAIETGNHEQAYERLTRAQRIVLEMEQGLNHSVAPELCRRMSALYMFVYRKLIDGCVQRDLMAIDEALKILTYERETWSMLMEKLAGEKRAAGGGPQQTGWPAGEGGDGAIFVEG